MVLPGHLAGGYLAAIALVAVFDPALTGTEITYLYIIGTLAGELPDVDIAAYALSSFIKKTKRTSYEDSHRNYITHTPVFWLAISLLVSLIGYLSGSTLVTWSGFALLAGTWSHLLLDTIEYGIRWLWPFSNKRFFLIQTEEKERKGSPATFSYYWDFIRDSYVKRASFYAEIAITLIALYIVFFK